MRILTVLIMVLFLAAGSVYAKDDIMQGKAGDYTVTAQFAKTPPTVGENTLTVQIKDPSGKLVTDKKVEVEYFMTEKVAPTRKYVEMPYMRAETAATPQESGYKAKLDFSMAGPWNIAVKIDEKGKAKKAKFHVNVK